MRPAGIPPKAGYNWASVADGFRKWRFAELQTESAPSRLHRLRVDRRQNHRFQLGVEKTISPESPESGTFQGAGIPMTPEISVIDALRPPVGAWDGFRML